MKKYNHRKIDKKWQSRWSKEGIYSPDIAKTKNKFYNLWMFPYPSGEGLHAGHAFASTGSDIFGRYQRMNDCNVFQPIGYDSFGIHTENFAINTGSHPAKLLSRTTDNYERQMRALGHGFDWTRTVTTSDIDYYRWTQWLFTEMFKTGLAYRKKAPVNWCPSCKTVLADEQVMTPKQAGKKPRHIDGSKVNDPENAQVCERCGHVVEIRNLAQWFFRITDYADRLLDNLERIDWSERVAKAQRNWIGKKQGINITYRIKQAKKEITCWTSRPDTNFGATFIVVSPEYAKENLIDLTPPKHKKEVEDYIEATLKTSAQDRAKEGRKKTGVNTGLFAVNRLNNYKMPIWIADFVLSNVGTGAVVGVPGHDKRDFEFAKEFGIEIIPVIIPEREYVDNNAKAYYKKRSKLHKKLLIELAKKADKAKKKLILMGGWAVSMQVGQEFRDFEDIDLVVMEDDIDWWKNTLKDLGMDIGNIYPKKNEKYCFQAQKKDVHIDLGAIRIKGGRVYWLDDKESEKSDPFEKLFEKKTFEGVEIYTMKKHVLYHVKKNHGGEVRWKDHADFLFMGFEAYEGEGILTDSGDFSGQRSEEAREKITDHLVKKGWGERVTNYHLRDWLISRQRYWGPPIPMIYCQSCAKKGNSYFKDRVFKGVRENQSDWDHAGWYPVPDSDLPVKLPNIKNYKPKGTGRGPLDDHPEFYKVKCPHCDGDAKRETDVSDTFLDSSWYFLRYPSVNLEREGKKVKEQETPWDPKITESWLPVDLYFGGAEHSVLHLMYARFVTMMLHDLGHIKFDEPFPKFFAHGLMIKDGAKMSKSRGNVVNPDEYIEKFGADALRLYLMFMGPMDGYPDFRDTGIEGTRRFIERVWALYQVSKEPANAKATAGRQIPSNKQISNSNISNNKNDKSLEIKMHQTIKKVTEDIEKYHYNTAISAIMEYTNALRAQFPISNYQLSNNSQITNHQSLITNHLTTLALLLAPFAPHMTEEIWSTILGQKGSIHVAKWPTHDPKMITTDTVTIPIQMNGKLRSQIEVDTDIAQDKSKVLQLAKKDHKISNWLKGKKIIKEVFVPGKLVNIVV